MLHSQSGSLLLLHLDSPRFIFLKTTANDSTLNESFGQGSVYRAPSILDQVDGRSPGRPLPIANLTLEFMTKPADAWSCMDVQAWLHSMYLGQYCAAVASATISGPILVKMQDLDLRIELGVVSPVHRRKMMEALGE